MISAISGMVSVLHDIELLFVNRELDELLTKTLGFVPLSQMKLVI